MRKKEKMRQKTILYNIQIVRKKEKIVRKLKLQQEFWWEQLDNSTIG